MPICSSAPMAYTPRCGAWCSVTKNNLSAISATTPSRMSLKIHKFLKFARNRFCLTDTIDRQMEFYSLRSGIFIVGLGRPASSRTVPTHFRGVLRPGGSDRDSPSFVSFEPPAACPGAPAPCPVRILPRDSRNRRREHGTTSTQADFRQQQTATPPQSRASSLLLSSNDPTSTTARGSRLIPGRPHKGPLTTVHRVLPVGPTMVYRTGQLVLSNGKI